MIYLFILNYVYINFLFTIQRKKENNFQLIFFCFLIIFFVAFRFEVGGDWESYKDNYQKITNLGLFKGLISYNSKFAVLIVHATKNFSILTETLVLGVIYSFFYTKYLLSTKSFFLSLYVTFPVFLFLVGLGYVHQGVAITICWQLLINYRTRTIKEIIAYVLLASLIHMSALIFLYFVIPKFKNFKFFLKYIKNFFSKWIAVIFLILACLHLTGIDFFLDLYIDVRKKFLVYLFHDYYASNGTLLRVFLFIPSLYIFKFIELDFFKKKDNLELLNLLKCSLLLMFITLLISAIFRASILFAFVDRIFFCFIFFQVFVLTAYYKQYKLRDNILIDLATYLFPFVYLLMLVFFSKYATWWIPYKNILLNQ